MLTIAITAETPMMMPSIVRDARILLRTRARKATRMIIMRFILFPIAGCRLLLIVVVVIDHWQVLQLFSRITRILNLLVRLDLSILEHHYAARVLRDVGLVRDEHQRDASLPVQPLKDLHHFD